MKKILGFVITIAVIMNAATAFAVQPMPLVPEPSTIVLLGVGAIGVIALARKNRKK